MTKDKKLGRMSTTSEKRRSFISSGSVKDNTIPSSAGPSKPSHGGSSTHILHTSNPRSSSSSNTAAAAANIIAPPPRAHHAPATSTTPNTDDATGPSTKDAKHKETRPKDVAGSGSGSNTGSPNSAAQIKDKDARIAHLERELEIMEQEFTRELDKLSQNESETAVFWQSKHSDLNSQFLRADTDLRQLRAEAEARDADRDVLRREVNELRAQVRGLKEFVSTSTRTSGQTSDEVFCDGMARLGNGLQNWVIVNYRRARLHFAAASDDVRGDLACLVPMYADLESSAKVHVLQSVVSGVLVDEIFDSYYFGLPTEQAEQFKAVEQTLSSYVDSPEEINNWRSTTLTLIHRTAETKLQTETAAATSRAVARINRLLDAITDAKASETRDAALGALVAGAADLARQLAVQKAVFRVHMPELAPHQSTKFDPDTMEDVGGEDEDALAQRDIACVTFPGVIKRGDENGGHMQYQNVIAKARVLCSPE
ncbi:hypothetical protein CCHL11_01559 [Colletotrichum chlorophyti]|uniref:Uncharacterized protein n=1 Tax=Colletotrichum chlorophyti TaxID=708187 RepID=A0A1Q8RYU0_9PEZI|nr:hypothetical protein CCHL11_01559 [Colletotrichum chlorophyti]